MIIKINKKISSHFIIPKNKNKVNTFFKKKLKKIFDFSLDIFLRIVYSIINKRKEKRKREVDKMTYAVVYTKEDTNKTYLYRVTYSAERAQEIANEMNAKNDGNYYFAENNEGYKDL